MCSATAIGSSSHNSSNSNVVNKKSVSFETICYIREIPHRKDLSQESKQRRWLPRTSRRKSYYADVLIAKLIQQQQQQQQQDDEQTSSITSFENDLQQPQKQNDGTLPRLLVENNVNCKNHDTKHFTFRGLEFWMMNEKERHCYDQRLHSAIQTVIRGQTKSGVSKDQLAQLYQEHSKPFCEHARDVGLQDEQIVEQLWKTSAIQACQTNEDGPKDSSSLQQKQERIARARAKTRTTAITNDKHNRKHEKNRKYDLSYSTFVLRTLRQHELLDENLNLVATTRV